VITFAPATPPGRRPPRRLRAREARRPVRRDTRKRVLEHRRVGRSHAERSRGGEERVRRRLSLQSPLGRDDAVYPHLEQLIDARRGQHLPAIHTRRNDGTRDTGASNGAYVTHRARIGIHSLAANQRQNEVVLAVPEPAHRRGGRRIGRIPVRKLDPSRREEAADPVVAPMAVDVLVVVVARVERDERIAGSRCASAQERVEQLLPCGSVDGRRLC